MKNAIIQHTNDVFFRLQIKIYNLITHHFSSGSNSRGVIALTRTTAFAVIHFFPMNKTTDFYEMHKQFIC
jgi:hypothetical protein